MLIGKHEHMYSSNGGKGKSPLKISWIRSKPWFRCT